MTRLHALLSLLLVLPVFALAGPSATPEATAVLNPASRDVNHVRDRDVLINDGSFENGTCGLGSSWTCVTNTTCDFIIASPDIYGWSPAIDGTNAAWLGGYCSEPNTNSFCQDILIDGIYLDWYWEGWINYPCAAMEIRVDGDLVFYHAMDWADDGAGAGLETRFGIHRPAQWRGSLGLPRWRARALSAMEQRRLRFERKRQYAR